MIGVCGVEEKCVRARKPAALPATHYRAHITVHTMPCTCCHAHTIMQTSICTQSQCNCHLTGEMDTDPEEQRRFEEKQRKLEEAEQRAKRVEAKSRRYVVWGVGLCDG